MLKMGVKNWRPAFWLVLLVAVAVLALPACSGAKAQSSRPDDPAPDFRLDNLDRQSVSLSSFRGKTVFLNFWATTCPPCVAEMPHIQEFYRDWAEQNGVMVLAINNGEDAATVRNFLQKGGYTFPVLMDSRGQVSQIYRVIYIPTSIIIDPRGLIKYRVVGPFQNKAAIIKAVEPYLK
jgi:peroxiredoxin